jgi:hypothetical protein
MGSQQDGQGGRRAPMVEAEYIPAPSVSIPREARRAPSGTRTILLYILLAPLVGGITAGAVVYQRYQSKGDLGHIEVNANPPDSTVFLDGQQVADRSPASIAVRQGVYNLAIQRPGFTPIEQKVDVSPGQIVAVSVALVVAPPAERSQAAPRAHRPKSKLPPKLDGVVYVDMGKGSTQAVRVPAADPPPAAGAPPGSTP